LQAGLSVEVTTLLAARCSTMLADCICHTPRPNIDMVSVSETFW